MSAIAKLIGAAIATAILSMASGCAIEPGIAAPVGTEPTSQAESAASLTAAPSASASRKIRRPVGDYLPAELDGVELHTFAVSQDVTGRLAQLAGVDIGELELAYASEHGARFIQVIAARAPGVSPERLRALFPAAAFPPDGADAEVTQAELAGTAVSAVSSPATVSRLGTYYLLVRDDALVVVQSFDPADAEDAIAALPRPGTD